MARLEYRLQTNNRSNPIRTPPRLFTGFDSRLLRDLRVYNPVLRYEMIWIRLVGVQKSKPATSLGSGPYQLESMYLSVSVCL